MRNKSYTVTIDQLNNSGTIIVDATMLIEQNSITYGTVNTYLFPNELQCINQTGAILEYNTFANDEEYSGFVANSTNYDFIIFPDNYYLVDENLVNRCTRFAIKKNDTNSAVSDLRIDFINYIKRV